MTQSKRRRFLIDYLDKEGGYGIGIPKRVEIQYRILRALMNVRRPGPISDDFLAVQDEFLQEETRKKGIVSLDDLSPVKGQLYLWQGDITRLATDAIVNAANSGMTGCYVPCHGCIDNCIHSYAGIQLRNECDAIMQAQGFEEPTGQAKITSAWNLPSKHVIHTVGPIVYGPAPTESDRDLLASCYQSCLRIADEHGILSIAFCCISTGEFHYPNREAAEVAIRTVEDYLEKTGSRIKVVFNVFKDADLEIYRELLH